MPVVRLLPLSMFYELFGLPLGRLRRMAAVWGVPMLSDGPMLAAPSPEGRVRAPRQLRRYQLGYRAGPPLSVSLGRLALVICPSTCPLWAEERLCHFRRPDSVFFRHDDTLPLGASHNAAKHTNLLRKAVRRSATYTVTRYVQKQQLQALSCNVPLQKVPHTRCS